MSKSKPLCHICDNRATTSTTVDGVDHPVCASCADWINGLAQREQRATQRLKQIRAIAAKLREQGGLPEPVVASPVTRPTETHLRFTRGDVFSVGG